MTARDQAPTEETIGVAEQEADGTIVLTLRAEGPGGMGGDGRLRYPSGHKDHDMVSRHVGPIPKGGVGVREAVPGAVTVAAPHTRIPARTGAAA